MADRSFAAQLHRESDAWVVEGIVTPEQAATIRSRYADAQEQRRGSATTALAVIGGVAIGVGVLAFVAANWDGMSHGARLALLTLTVASVYAGGYQLRDRAGTAPRVGEALYLLGVIAFGASIFLVGQMYNVQAHDPLGLLLWAGGATATALVVRSRAIAVTAVLVFTAWIGFEFGLALDDAGGDSFAAFPAVAVLYGGALYALATMAQERIQEHWFARSGFPEAARGVGLPLAALGLFVFTFPSAAEELVRAGEALEGGLLAAFLGLAAIGLVAAGLLTAGRRPSARYEGGALLVAVTTMVIPLFAGGDGDLYAILFNVLFATVALGVIYAGYLSAETWLVNLGVLLVAVDLVGRYFDVFWSALPRSLGLIGGGLLVLGIAYVLERQRKRLLRRMGES
jgi:uncharacterized membrane protein